MRTLATASSQEVAFYNAFSFIRTGSRRSQVRAERPQNGLVFEPLFAHWVERSSHGRRQYSFQSGKRSNSRRLAARIRELWLCGSVFGDRMYDRGSVLLAACATLCALDHCL